MSPSIDGTTSGPSTNIRLYLRATHLPTTLTAHGYRQPDTFARVSLVTPNAHPSASTQSTQSTHTAYPPNSPHTLRASATSTSSQLESTISSSYDAASRISSEESTGDGGRDANDDLRMIPRVAEEGVGMEDRHSGERRSQSQHDQVLDETETVHKSSNPRWTTSFSATYEYGSQMLFFVDVYVMRGSALDGSGSSGGDVGYCEGGEGGGCDDATERTNQSSKTSAITKRISNAGKIMYASAVGGVVGKRGWNFIGRAVFDVQDVLGMTNNIKARRLRKGGVVYAHIEQQPTSLPLTRSITASSDSSATTTERSLRQSLKALHTNRRILTLRLRAHSLIHTTSFQNRIAPSTISNPDTYFEISRPSYLTTDHDGTIRTIPHYGPSSTSWIPVYRSSPIKESVSPMWDQAMIDLDSLYSTSTSSTSHDSNTSINDLSTYPIMITVYKVKKKKCKPIGSFQTTVQSLIDAYGHSTASTRSMTYENGTDIDPYQQYQQYSESVTDDGAENNVEFDLHPTAVKGADSSQEVKGKVAVVKAYVEQSQEVWQRSQRFMSNDAVDVDVGEGLIQSRALGDMSSHDESTIPTAMPTIPTANGDPPLPESYSAHPYPVVRPRHAQFADYVNAGLDIDFCVAIDFTSSNGDPRTAGTLHYSRDGMMNDYEEAIEAIGSTISKYSTNKEFPVWGFGAKYDGEVRHIFQCGGESTAKGVEGILDAYRTVFETDLIMSGPTVMLSVLRAAAGRSKRIHKESNSNKNMKYCVLLILTDGMVSDFHSTQEHVRAYRELPLSIVVVGIGRADFSQMHWWNNSPFNLRGRFSFVDFREHQFDPDALSRKALEKVPHDVVDYFVGRHILP